MSVTGRRRTRWLLLSVLLAAVPVVAQPIDLHATRETRNLFANRQRLAQRGAMFGHQNTLTYGHDWAGDADRSDVKDVTGVYPAVYGWDIMDIFADKTGRLDPAKAARLRAFVAAAHARGGVNTFSWHMPNPVTGTDAWDMTPAVAAILPGGRLHDAYRRRLDIAGTFLASLKDTQGRPIPVWFRPFHEQTGAWFWWGRGNASAADFVALWRSTVGYLRDTRRVHNLLYAYSTDIFDGAADYFAFYPGDRWVDMLGFDDYHSIESTRTRDVFVRRLADVTRWAGERGKIAALTETGLEKLPDPQWWTQVLLPGLQAPSSRGISYVLVWRNANAAREKREHFFAPYRGEASAADFVRFEKSPMTLFEPDLPNLYANPAAR